MRTVHEYSNEARTPALHQTQCGASVHEFCPMMPGITLESVNLRRAFVYSCDFVDSSSSDLLLPRLVSGEVGVEKVEVEE